MPAALSGHAFALGLVLRGPIDLADPGSCCRLATPPTLVPGWTIIVVGGVLHLYGLFGLYRYLTYQAGNLLALPALVLTIMGIALVLPGNREVIAVLEATFSSPLGLTLLGISSGAGVVGPILFAVGIWRDGRLPKWTGVLFGLTGLLLPIPVTFATESMGTVLLLISTSVMARRGWQESAAATG